MQKIPEDSTQSRALDCGKLRLEQNHLDEKIEIDENGHKHRNKYRNQC